MTHRACLAGHTAANWACGKGSKLASRVLSDPGSMRFAWLLLLVSTPALADHELVRDLGADPVSYGPGLADRVRETVASVDAVLDAAGKGELKGTFKLVGGTAARGSSVRLPLIINANGLTQGFSFSLDFDEEVLEATGIEEVFHHPSKAAWEYQKFYFDNSNTTPGNAGVDEGFVSGTGVFDFTLVVGLPPDVDSEVVALHFKVKPDAPLGSTELRFVDGASSDSSKRFTVVNDITAKGMALDDPPVEVTPLFTTARLGIVGDISMFIRGDSNGDGRVDLSDAQHTLSFLFLGGETLQCEDAADANDDGTLNVSDPIFVLLYLFLGGARLPEPSLDFGADPTPDTLTCPRPGE